MQFFDRLAVLLLVIGCCTYGALGAAPAKATGCKPLYGITYDPFAFSTEDICVSKEQVRRHSRQPKPLNAICTLGDHRYPNHGDVCQEHPALQHCRVSRDHVGDDGTGREAQCHHSARRFSRNVGRRQREGDEDDGIGHEEAFRCRPGYRRRQRCLRQRQNWQHRPLCQNPGPLFQPPHTRRQLSCLFFQDNVDLLVGYIDRVKKILRKHKLTHPVTTAEGWGVWESEHGATLAE